MTFKHLQKDRYFEMFNDNRYKSRKKRSFIFFIVFCQSKK